MKRKKSLLFCGLGLGFMTMMALGACDSGKPPVEPIPVDELTTQEIFIDSLINIRNFDADLDISVKYDEDDYSVKGYLKANMNNLEDIKFSADLTVDLDVDKFQVNATYIDETVFLSINEKRLKMYTDDLGDIINVFTSEIEGDDEEEEEKEKTINSLTSLHLKEIVANIGDMTATKTDSGYTFVTKTAKDYPDIVFTSNNDYKLTSMSMTGIKFNDFTISFNLATRILEDRSDRITSPETAETPYINITNYMGTMKQIKKIISKPVFGLEYNLGLTHENVYLGKTTGFASVDLKNYEANIDGTIYIDDPATEVKDDYHTDYNAQYFDENIYLNYGGLYTLSYSNKGLADLFDVLGDEDVFGVSIFDLLWGATGKVYPILDALQDGTYKDLYQYIQKATLTDTYFELVIDNKIAGGEDNGTLRANIDKDKGITSLEIINLDINGYVVDGSLALGEYKDFEKVSTDGYDSLDGLDGLLKGLGKIYKSTSLGLEVNANVTNKDEQTLKAKVTAQASLRGATVEQTVIDLMNYKALDLSAKAEVTDFGNNKHELILETYQDKSNAEEPVDYLCVSYNATEEASKALRAKATYSSIGDIYNLVMEYLNQDTGSGEAEEQSSLPIIGGAPINTIEKVLNGDAFAILRDEIIKSINVEHKGEKNDVYKLVIDKDALNLAKDLTVKIAVENEVITSIDVDTKYGDFSIDVNLKFKAYDDSINYINNKGTIRNVSDIANIPNYLTDKPLKNKFAVVDQIMKIVNSKEVGLTLSLDVSQGGSQLIALKNGTVNLKLDDTVESESLLDKLDVVLNGKLYYSDNSKNLPFEIALQNGVASLSYRETNPIKLKIETDKINEAIAEINELFNTEVLEGLNDNTNEALLPILKLVDEKDYAAILDLYGGSEIVDDTLRITLSNAIFSEGDTSNFTIDIKTNEDGIDYVEVKGLTYSGYTLNFKLGLEEYAHKDIDVTNYEDLGEVLGIVDQVKEILDNQKVAAEIDVTYGDYSIVGTIQADIINRSFDADVVVGIGSGTNAKEYHLYLESDYQGCYTAVITDNDEVRVNISSENVNRIIDSVSNMIKDDGSVLSKIIKSIVSGSQQATDTKPITDYLFEDFIKSIVFKNNNTVLDVVLNGESFGMEGEISISATLDEHKLESLRAILEYNGNDVDASITLIDYNGSYHAVSTTMKHTGTWISSGTLDPESGSIADVVEYVETIDEAKQQALIDQFNKLMEERQIDLGIVLTAYYNSEELGSADLLANIDLVNSDIDINGDVTIPVTSGPDFVKNVRLSFVDGVLYLVYQDEGEDPEHSIKLSLPTNDISKLISAVMNLLPAGDSSEESVLPVLNLISEGKFLSLFNYYQGVKVDGDTITLFLDNSLVGGAGNAQISFTLGDNGISEISISGANYREYGLDITLTIKDFSGIDYDSIHAGDYSSLEDLPDLINDGYNLYSEKKLAADIEVSFTNTNKSEDNTLTVDGEFQLDFNDLTGGADLTIVDFSGNNHALKMQSGEVNEEQHLYVNYQFNETEEVKAEASYQALYDIYQNIMKYLNGGEESEQQGSILDTIARFFGGAGDTTLEKVLNGEYLALITDDAFESFYIDNEDVYHIVVSEKLLGTDTDIHIDIATKVSDNLQVLKGLHLSGQYNGYALDATITLNEYSTDPLNYVTGPFTPLDSVSDILDAIMDKTDEDGALILLKQVTQIIEDKEIGLSINATLKQDNQVLINITNGQLNAKLTDVFAPNYKATSAYEVDDLVNYKGKYYKCVSAIALPGEEWTEAHWTEVSFEYKATSPYSLHDYVMHEGKIYQCIVAIGEGGEAWNEEHWKEVTLVDRADATLSAILSDVPLIEPTEYNPESAYAVGALVTHEGVAYKCNTAIGEGGEEWNIANWTEATIVDLIDAPAYSSSATYALDDLVKQGGNAYRCITAIGTPETFKPAKWQLVHLPFKAGYTDINDTKTLYLRLNENVKIKCDKDSIFDIIDAFQAIMGGDESESSSGGFSLSIPALEYFRKGEYQHLLNAIKGISVGGEKLNEITITLSNSLFTEGDESTCQLVVGFDDDGLASLVLNNVKYNQYSLDLDLGLQDYSSEDKPSASELNTYTDASKLVDAVEQIQEIVTSKKGAFTIFGAFGDFDYNISVQGDLTKDDTHSPVYYAEVELKRFTNRGLNIYDTYNLEIIGSGENLYINYDEDSLKAFLGYESVDNIIDAIKDLLGVDFSSITGGSSEQSTSSFDIKDLIFGDMIQTLEYDDTPGTYNAVYVAINGSSFGLGDLATLTLRLNKTTNHIERAVAMTTINDQIVNLNVDFEEYDDNISYTPTGIASYYDISFLGDEDVLDLLFTQDSNKKLVILEQVLDLLSEKETGLDVDIAISKGGDTILTLNGEDAKGINLKLKDAPDYSSLSTYALGAIVTKGEKVYKCISAIESPESWTAEHWAEADLFDRLDVVLDATLGDGDTNEASLVVALQNRLVSLNYKDLIQLSVEYDNLMDIFAKVMELVNSEEAAESGSGDSLFPINDMLKDKNYQAILESIKGLSVEGENENKHLVLTVANSLLDVNAENDFRILLTINATDGITALALENLKYGEYGLTGSLGLKDYTSNVVDTTGYIPLDDAGALIDQVKEILDQQALGLDNINIVINDYVIPEADYDEEATYEVGDLVTYDGKVYKCNTAIAEAEPWTIAHWTEAVVASAYSDAETYKVNDYVVYNEVVYKCNTAINEGEAWTEGHWTETGCTTYVKRIAGNYSASATYAVNDRVRYNGKVYKCDTAVTTPEEFDEEKWTEVSIVVTGYVQAKLNNKVDFGIKYDEYDQPIIDPETNEPMRDIRNVHYFGADLTITQNGNTYHIILENTADKCYLTYSQTKGSTTSTTTTYINELNLLDIVSTIKDMLTTDDNLLYDYIHPLIGDLLNGGSGSGDINYVEYLFKDYIKTINYNGTLHTLTVELNGEELGLANDVEAVIHFNGEHKVASLDADGFISEHSEVIGSLDIVNYDENHEFFTESEKTSETRVNLSPISTGVNYIRNISKETQENILKQVTDLMENKKAGLTYNVRVAKTRGGTPVIEIQNGNLDISLANLSLSDIANMRFGMSGTIVRTNNATNPATVINMPFDIRLVDNGIAYVYFKHGDEANPIKAMYELAKLNSLKTLLMEQAEENPSLQALLDALFPEDDGSSNPLMTALSNGDYVSLLNYFKDCYTSVDGNILYISFDGAMIGLDDATINVGFDTANYGLHSIYLEDFYFMGYYLSGEVTVKQGKNCGYVEPVAPSSEELVNYTDLSRVNDIAEDVIKLFGNEPQQIAYKVSGHFGDMVIDGSLGFELNQANKQITYQGQTEYVTANEGSVNVIITNGDKTHFIDADILAVLYDLPGSQYQTNEAALKELLRIPEESRTTAQNNQIASLQAANDAIEEAANDRSAITFSYGDSVAAYNPNKSYAVGDWVSYAGYYYQCKTATAGTSEVAVPFNAGSWTQVRPYVAAYSTSSKYAVGDYVSHDGGVYECKTAITSTGAWNSSKWTYKYALDATTYTLPADASSLHGPKPAPSDRMYGQLNLGTVFDVVGLVREVMSGDNPRFANIMEIFSGDVTETIFGDIMSGDLEALLDNQVIKQLSLTGDTYTIVLNGEIFKIEQTDDTRDFTIELETQNTGKQDPEHPDDPEAILDFYTIASLSVDGVYQGTDIDLTLEKIPFVSEYTSIKIDTKNRTVYEFSELKDLAEHLLNVVQLNDFDFSGTMDITFPNFPGWVVSLLGIQDTQIQISMDGSIKTDEFGYENIVARLLMTGIPKISYVSEDSWKKNTRTFELYLQNLVQYQWFDAEDNPVEEDDPNAVRKAPILNEKGSVQRDAYVYMIVNYTQDRSGSPQVHKEVKVTLDEFMKEISYYLINFGLGIKRETSNIPTIGVIETNLHSNPDVPATPTMYSILLEDYEYSNTDDNPTWDVVLNAEELFHNDSFDTINMTIYGANAYKGVTDHDRFDILKEITGDLMIAGQIKVDLGLTFNYLDDAKQVIVVDQATIDGIIREIGKHEMGASDNIGGWSDNGNRANLILEQGGLSDEKSKIIITIINSITGPPIMRPFSRGRWNGDYRLLLYHEG